LPRRRRSILCPYTTLFRSEPAASADQESAEISSGRKPVADTPNCLDPAGLFWIIFDCTAQTQNRNIDGSVVTLAFVIIARQRQQDRKSTRLNSSHVKISYA